MLTLIYLNTQTSCTWKSSTQQEVQRSPKLQNVVWAEAFGTVASVHWTFYMLTSAQVVL